MTPGDADEKKLVLDTLSEAWRSEPGVPQFGLVYFPERMEYAYGAWTVPIATRVHDGSAYELMRVIERLNETVETKTSRFVSLYLDPFAAAEKGQAA